jgi:hypothetical protein
MKQICTQVAILCLLTFAQNLYAQSVNVSTSYPTPAPTPDFTTTDSINASNGFTSNSTGTFNNFPKNKTTTITSPSYYYSNPQSIVSFVFNMSVATAGSTTTAPVISIIPANGNTITATASTITLSGVAGVDYYFTFDLGTTLSVNTNFKISLTMDVANNDKAVTAYTLTTNALKGTAPVNSPLPVAFSGFFARNISSGISLTWNVGTEKNVSGYEVQRSTDGNSFSEIGFVTAHNQSSYSFIDGEPAQTAFYRIKSIDLDGKYVYSTIINIKGQHSAVIIKAFPTLVQNQLTVQHSTATNNGKIEILSVNGSIIKSVSLATGTQQTAVDLSSAKAGVYVVRFVNGSTIESLKVIKQ